MKLINKPQSKEKTSATDLTGKETITSVPERDYSFDNIKAFLIFSVVYAHYLRMSSTFAVSTVGGVLYLTSFSYIMQGFLFVSGYFSRNVEKCRRTAFQTFLFPYIILMPLMFLIRYSIFGHAHLDITLPTMALWYLLTLFYYRFFLKDLIRIKWILLISVVVSLLAGFSETLDVTLSLGRSFGFLPFFLLGYYCKKEHIERIRKVPKAVSVLLVFCLMGFVVLMAYSKSIPISALYFKASYNSTHLDNLTGIGIRILFSVVSLAWIFVFINLAPRKKTKLAIIGQNTMVIYILHIIVRYVVKANGEFFGQDAVSYLLLLAAALVSIWLFSRPVVARGYQSVMDGLYFIVFYIPKAIIRKIKKS
jgi:Fucose 4-O-acetylase and related acetyltransferases